MGMVGTTPAAGRVLLAGDAAGLVNPLQGEGIGPAMVSARAAAEAILTHPGRAGQVYAETLRALMHRYLAGAAALQETMLARPRLASAGMRLITAPPLRSLVAGTWSLYWNGLVDGAVDRPSARAAALAETLAWRLASHRANSQPTGLRMCSGRSSRASRRSARTRCAKKAASPRTTSTTMM
jgi:flavin-dependent dehydrogenase